MKMTDKIFLSGIIFCSFDFMGQLNLFLCPLLFIQNYIRNYLLRSLTYKFNQINSPFFFTTGFL